MIYRDNLSRISLKLWKKIGGGGENSFITDQTIETEYFFHRSQGEQGLDQINNALIVGGYPTYMDTDCTTEILEYLDRQNIDTAMVKLDSEKYGDNPVYNTKPSEIVEDIEEAYNSFEEEPTVFGYCLGGIYALEAIEEETNFIGLDIPSAIQTENNIFSPEPPENSIFLYNSQMEGRIPEIEEWQEITTENTGHYWENTPEEMGEAVIKLAEALGYEKDLESRLEQTKEEYSWIENRENAIENPSTKTHLKAAD